MFLGDLNSYHIPSLSYKNTKNLMCHRIKFQRWINHYFKITKIGPIIIFLIAKCHLWKKRTQYSVFSYCRVVSLSEGTTNVVTFVHAVMGFPTLQCSSLVLDVTEYWFHILYHLVKRPSILSSKYLVISFSSIWFYERLQLCMPASIDIFKDQKT